jgi:hypothetical protein
MTSEYSETLSQAAIRAELTADTATADGITARGATPVLNLCRELIAAGLRPDAALDVFRNGILALRVRSIGEAARLTVKTGGNGAPTFVRHTPGRSATALLVRNSSHSLVNLAEAAE